MMAPKLRFWRGLKAKAPGAVTACVLAPTPLVKIFTSPSTEHKKQRWWRWRYFVLRVLSSVWLLFYQSFDTAHLLWSSPDSWLAMFHSRRCSYIRTDDPSTKARRAFTVSWNIKVFVHSSRVVIFSPRHPRHQFPLQANLHRHHALPSLSTRRNQLSPRSPSSRKPSNVQLLPACVTSGNIHNAVSRHLDKNRAKHRRAVFSLKKAQESKQRPTNWQRRHLGDMQQQPRRWLGFDKCVETKLMLDVFIRPWPPGWSFLRRIYVAPYSRHPPYSRHFSNDTHENDCVWALFPVAVSGDHSSRQVCKEILSILSIFFGEAS